MGNFSLPDPAQERTLPTKGQTEAKCINLINTKQKLKIINKKVWTKFESSK